MSLQFFILPNTKSVEMVVIKTNQNHDDIKLIQIGYG